MRLSLTKYASNDLTSFKSANQTLQLNASQLIQSIVLRHPTLQVTKNTPVPLLPRTASLLLALASYFALIMPFLVSTSRLAATFADLPLPSFSAQSILDAFPSSGSESPNAGTLASTGYLRLKDVFATGIFALQSVLRVLTHFS